jgi:CelD/BcsL family acetyltransferase involved in cellulose biosynthesis
MADHFLRRERCDTISIGPFSDESASKTAFVASFRRMNDASVDFTEKPFGVYTYFTLPDSFEEYMVALAPKQKKHRVKYDLNAMSKEYSVRLDVLQDPEKVSSEFPGFLRLHTDQWRNEGKPGHFGAWPGSASFHRRLAAELAKQGRTRLIKVTADDTPIIYQYAYCFGDRCYWLLPARIIGKQWDRFSLGQKATVALIRCLIEEKIKHIEAGVSHYDYKSRLGAIESKISTLRLTSRRLGSRMKSSLLEKCFYAVNIVYYKIWYCRIQPRLPSRFHFPVWKAWIDLNV